MQGPNGVQRQRFMVPVVIEKDDDGYFAECPALQGCFTQGDTYEEVIANIRDAISLHVEDRQALGETVDFSRQVSVTTLEIAA